MRPSSPNAASAPILGIILMVAITVALVVTAVASVQKAREGPTAQAPQFQRADDGGLKLADPAGAETWSDFDVQGCEKPDGAADAGDRLESCAGDVRVVDKESGDVVFEGSFPAR